ncbi:MAG: DUF4254 domain-containing protein [Planctomycetota bacterium]|nr:MAG: DUF4254 domain-containing protein [Planctomycetota bacterium]
MTTCSSQCGCRQSADPSSPPLPAADIDSLLERLVAEWHVVDPAHKAEELEGRICDLHKFNFQLWHEEDIARSPEVTDARIAEVKRNIDRFNQARNDSIEKVDDWLVAELGRRQIEAPAGTPAATETPGSAVDRLSILELRRFHMREQIDRADATREHREKAAARMAVLDAQRGHLIEALDRLLTEIFLGQRPLRVFRMMKMYNDPSMNPYLYKAQGQAAA